MTEPFFTTTAQVRAHVKLQASLPWESLSPYVDEARDEFLKRYLSDAKLTLLEPNATFMSLARHALAPLAVYLAADEMSISIGDSGITVQNEKERRSPASDRKIQAAKRSLLRRGTRALGELLSYVMSLSSLDLSDCPRLKLSKSLLVRDMETFDGYVPIDRDWTVFLDLVPLMRTVQEELEQETDADLIARAVADTTGEGMLFCLAQKSREYVVLRTAALMTSTVTREQRAAAADRVEYTPLIRPVFEDREDRGSWYSRRADSLLAAIKTMIDSNRTALGLEEKTALPTFENGGRRIFSM